MGGSRYGESVSEDNRPNFGDYSTPSIAVQEWKR